MNNRAKMRAVAKPG